MTVWNKGNSCFSISATKGIGFLMACIYKSMKDKIDPKAIKIKFN